MLKRVTSLMIFIAIVFGQQSKSGLELEESTIQGVLTVKLAKADAKEDFNSGLKWSALSSAAIIGGLFVGPLASAAPIYLILTTPVDNSRLNTLYTKNEKHRSIYQTAYEKEIRKQRSKYSLLATSSCIVDLGVFLVVAGYIGAYMLVSGIH